jgi:hypothetical protein
MYSENFRKEILCLHRMMCQQLSLMNNLSHQEESCEKDFLKRSIKWEESNAKPELQKTIVAISKK